MRNLNLKWPERKRCIKCHKMFDFLVLVGLYCSYRCAEHPDPHDIPRIEWPRKHFYWSVTTLNSNKTKDIKEKRFFFSREEAEKGLRPKESVYYCDFCLTWHRGTLRDMRDPRSSRSPQVAPQDQR